MCCGREDMTAVSRAAGSPLLQVERKIIIGRSTVGTWDQGEGASYAEPELLIAWVAEKKVS